MTVTAQGNPEKSTVVYIIKLESAVIGWNESEKVRKPPISAKIPGLRVWRHGDQTTRLDH
jgi:hypothetical protein